MMLLIINRWQHYLLLLWCSNRILLTFHFILQTYIHNWPLQPFSQRYGLAHTSHVVCVSGGTYSLTSTPNDRFLRNFFMAGLFALGVFCQKSVERKWKIFIFRYDESGLYINKPTHYLLDLGNFHIYCIGLFIKRFQTLQWGQKIQLLNICYLVMASISKHWLYWNGWNKTNKQ